MAWTASLLALVVAFGCSANTPTSWPKLGNVDERYTLHLDELSTVDGKPFIDPETFQAGARWADDASLFDDTGRLREDITRWHYPHLTRGTVDRHSDGIEVFFFEEENHFFLREDHVMGHMDGFLGPFVGDPRIALAEAAYKPVAPDG